MLVTRTGDSDAHDMKCVSGHIVEDLLCEVMCRCAGIVFSLTVMLGLGLGSDSVCLNLTRQRFTS